MTSFRSVFAALLLAISTGALAAQEAPWGDPVDGMAVRLTMRKPSYANGQAVSAVIELKNTSDKKRFLVPRLDPQAIEYLTIELTGPRGKVAQNRYSKGYGLGENSFKAIAAGVVIRHDVADLRDFFGDLPIGNYTAKVRFRSPMPPAKFVLGETVVNGKVVKMLKDVPAEIIAGQWSKEAVSAPSAFAVTALAQDDLVVHEWGVFTVFNDARYANLNRKEEWGSLPSFFYRQFPRQRLRWVPSAWDKPVVYFYAKQTPMKVNVKVTFSDGAPVVWWPAVSSPVDDPYHGGRKQVGPFRTLVWDAWLGSEVPSEFRRMPSIRNVPVDVLKGPFLKVEDFPLPDDCWLKHVRLPGATQLTVVGNVEEHVKTIRFPGAKDRNETERFLYYDGLVPAPEYLRCEKIDAKTLTLRNRGTFPIGPLFVVDRRAKDTVGFAHIDPAMPLQAGVSAVVELKQIPREDWPLHGAKQVRRALVAAGLFEPEADALLKIWERRLLEADGVTAFHLLPAREYDRMLPIEIRPAPFARPVRVGIALHPHIEIEPDLAKTVAGLIRQLDSAQFKPRAAAEKALLESGPMAIAMLRAALKEGRSLETTRRIEAVLNRVDASVWLELKK